MRRQGGRCIEGHALGTSPMPYLTMGVSLVVSCGHVISAGDAVVTAVEAELTAIHNDDWSGSRTQGECSKRTHSS